MKLKLETETWIWLKLETLWNLKLKLETETWNKNLKLKLEIETWNWNLKLKLKIETWNWNIGTALFFLFQNIPIWGLFRTFLGPSELGLGQVQIYFWNLLICFQFGQIFGLFGIFLALRGYFWGLGQVQKLFWDLLT